MSLIDKLDEFPTNDLSIFEEIITYVIEQPKEVLDLLNSKNWTDDESNIWIALSFLRDGIITQYNPDLNKRFKCFFAENHFTTTIRKLVESENLTIRSGAVYTLGKIGDTESLDFLMETFFKALNDDPLLISTLLFEIEWLSHHKYLTTLSQALLNQPCGGLRWALLDYLRSCVFEKGSRYHRLKLKMLKILSRDHRFYIRNEAQFERKGMLKKRSTGSQVYKGPNLQKINQDYIHSLKEANFVGYDVGSYEEFIKDYFRKNKN